VKKDDFGNRMKVYEASETARYFMPLLPVYARIDGRCFSAFTEGLHRPFDIRITRAMIDTTKYLVKQTNARLGYTQSDEISLVWQQDHYNSEIFFNGKIHKMCSLLASLASVKFYSLCMRDPELSERANRSLPVFDCRIFQLPNRTEAANAFVWREKDATKNAVSMAARTLYSHKELLGKGSSQMQEMIFQKGINFNDYPAFFKRGTFVRRISEQRTLTLEELATIPEKHRPVPDQPVTRSSIIEIEMPVFTKVLNREAVIFEGAAPRISEQDQQL
jgi:tRNA(His) 5'-end guanylyltransferase